MAANVFDVVAKVCTVTTNFLKFCRAGSARLALALAVGVFDVDCAAGEAGYTLGQEKMLLAMDYFWVGQWH